MLCEAFQRPMRAPNRLSPMQIARIARAEENRDGSMALFRRAFKHPMQSENNRKQD
jgi:hypothetical protein